MRIFLLLITATCIAFGATAQSGCTDPAALNFWASATTNDGSCTYATTYYNPLLQAPFATGIKESSGIVFSAGRLWTHNDSGNPAQIFSVDTTTGALLQTVFIDNFPNTDWEDIAADSAFIYVGNFGNNKGNRKDLNILKVAKADIGTGGIVHLNALSIAFSYTDQMSFANSSSSNFDCEAMLVRGDSLYLFTKNHGDNKTRVYRLPKIPGTYAVAPYTGFNVEGLVTGADYNEATKEVVLIGYLSGHRSPFLYFLNDFKGNDFFSGNKRRIEVTNGKEWQTEGICYAADGRFVIGCEYTPDVPASFYYGSRTLTGLGVTLPAENNSTGVLYPNPAEKMLTLKGYSNARAYQVFNATSAVVQRGTFAGSGVLQIQISGLPVGQYQLRVLLQNGQTAPPVSFLKY